MDGYDVVSYLIHNWAWTASYAARLDRGRSGQNIVKCFWLLQGRQKMSHELKIISWSRDRWAGEQNSKPL